MAAIPSTAKTLSSEIPISKHLYLSRSFILYSLYITQYCDPISQILLNDAGVISDRAHDSAPMKHPASFCSTKVSL